MFEVAIDTSVVVSAARSRTGASFQLINWVRQNKVGLALSPAMVLEYEALLLRQMLETGWTKADVDEFLAFACAVGRKVEPRFRLRPSLPDPSDEFVLELAFAAGVDFLVTLNGRHFAGAGPYGVTIIAPGEFARVFREQP
jgi:putative PIN family toxin of toxin-antitoxin system